MSKHDTLTETAAPAAPEPAGIDALTITCAVVATRESEGGAGATLRVSTANALLPTSAKSERGEKTAVRLLLFDPKPTLLGSIDGRG
jgi:hypothetical protein